jgi:hypothetical protein
MEAVLQGPTGRIVLGPTPLTIGRTPDNQLVMSDPKASSHHAEIRSDGSSFSIIDLGSTNGTFVNNQRIDRNIPRPLANGDRIRIGDTMFNYTATRVSESYGAPGGFSEYSPTVVASPYSEPPVGSSPTPSQFTGYGGPAPQQPPYMDSNYATPQQPYAQPPQPYNSPQQQYSSPSYTPYPPSEAALPNYAAPIPPPSFPPPAAPPPQPYPPTPAPKKRGAGSTILLIVLAAIVILAALGGFGIYHFLTLPKPVISVTSKYHVGNTGAGSTNTTLHVSGQKFSANSAITFLLDGATAPGSTTVQSDANGNVNADLTITSAWIVGDHTLTAKDANGYTTNTGIPVKIVPQGVASTPGPNGAPADDQKFTINISVQETDTATKKSLGSISQTLNVTGQPDPMGGTVCQSRDNGQPQPINGAFSNNGNSYTETLIYSCSGTYKSGKLSYTETVTSDKYTLSDHATCIVQTPYTYEQMQGTFSASTAISGTFSGAGTKANCTDNTTITSDPVTGMWNGQSSS